MDGNAGDGWGKADVSAPNLLPLSKLKHKKIKRGWGELAAEPKYLKIYYNSKDLSVFYVVFRKALGFFCQLF